MLAKARLRGWSSVIKDHVGICGLSKEWISQVWVQSLQLSSQVKGCAILLCRKVVIQLRKDGNGWMKKWLLLLRKIICMKFTVSPVPRKGCLLDTSKGFGVLLNAGPTIWVHSSDVYELKPILADLTEVGIDTSLVPRKACLLGPNFASNRGTYSTPQQIGDRGKCSGLQPPMGTEAAELQPGCCSDLRDTVRSST